MNLTLAPLKLKVIAIICYFYYDVEHLHMLFFQKSCMHHYLIKYIKSPYIHYLLRQNKVSQTIHIMEQKFDRQLHFIDLSLYYCFSFNIMFYE